jgi:hypothetical protein
MGVLVKAASRLFFVKTLFVKFNKAKSHRKGHKSQGPRTDRHPQQGMIAVKILDHFHRNQGK